MRGVLERRDGPPRRAVVANAAAALLAAEHVTMLAEGVARAKESLAAGRVRAALARPVECSNE